jgi:hypothetical protein
MGTLIPSTYFSGRPLLLLNLCLPNGQQVFNLSFLGRNLMIFQLFSQARPK